MAGITVDEHSPRQYRVDATAAQTGCQDHDFFKSLERTLLAIAQEYKVKTGARLFPIEEPRVDWKQKSFESALNKSYRLNVLKNKKFPEAPKGGWLGPDRWFEAFEDIIRCQLVCRYLDGPGFVVERLEHAASNAGLVCTYDSVQHDRGYYAFHLYLKVPVGLFKSTTTITVEIQLTTQLQDVVYDLTHGFYEDIRLMEGADQKLEAWKWEYTSARFKAGYLSHTLHLLEGLIAEVRQERLAPPAPEVNNEHTAEPKAPDAAGAVPPGSPKEGAGG